MATQEEKDLKKLDKSAQKEEKQFEKAEAKVEKRQRKEETNLRKARVKSLMGRAKDERKPAKRAAKQTRAERNVRKAVDRVQSVRKNFMGLPPILWPLTLVVSYIWFKNTWEKERHSRDLREARRFLKETRDIR